MRYIDPIMYNGGPQCEKCKHYLMVVRPRKIYCKGCGYVREDLDKVK